MKLHFLTFISSYLNLERSPFIYCIAFQSLTFHPDFISETLSRTFEELYFIMLGYLEEIFPYSYEFILLSLTTADRTLPLHFRKTFARYVLTGQLTV